MYEMLVIGAGVFETLATVKIKWINSRANRQVDSTHHDGKRVTANGYNVEEVAALLKKAKAVDVFQTKPDH